ncbi:MULTISPECIES: DUF2806 domain-containing protein [unclassified Oleiphilus]|uniref:DUF2806 domain-containing protein n=1 Tax=unclassified Oleiphilus TaxID=2631174 RepID=UPI000A9338D6|nr:MULTISPECIES: DUF2806 domain-containing protein [unclassified Oleiphilus]
MHGSKGKKKQIGTWSKLVALCTKSMGGYYRANGTVVRDLASDKASDEADEPIYVETDVAFASLNERTHARIRHQETLRQANIEAILAIASGLLGQKVTAKSVDSDWANIFFDYAQNVSSSPMQSLWARALLCELKRPHSISKRSLNFLYHCDAWEITAFKKVSNYAFIGHNGHPFVFRANNSLTKEDDIFSELRLLSHCVNAGMIARDPSELLVGYEFYYRKTRHSVSHDFTAPGQGVGFYTQAFTKTGSDLLKIIGGLDSIPSSNLQRRVVWEYLSDFIDIEAATANSNKSSTLKESIAG